MGQYDMAPGYIDSGDVNAKHIKQMMDHFYQSSYPQNSAYWMQGSIDKRFIVGDQTLNSLMYGQNMTAQQRRFFFNLIRRQIQMIVGYQRRNRKSTIVVPLKDGDTLADDYNACLKWCEEQDGFQEYFSQSFEGAVGVGQALLMMYPDFTKDPISSDLLTDNVSFQNYLIDPYWRKMDLSDCNFIWRRRWVSKTEAKQLLPGRADEIEKMRPKGVKDGRFPLQAELLNMSTNSLFAYDEFHYLTSRKAKIIIDPKTGETSEWEDDQNSDEDLKQILRIQPWLIVKETQIPTVNLAIVLGGETMYHGKNLLNVDMYPAVPMMCYHEPDIQSYSWRVQGVTRCLRDAQWLYNRRKVIELQILESQVNSGWIFPVDAVTDIKALRQTGEGLLIPLKAGHTKEELERIRAPEIPASMIELSRSLSDDIMKISGVNEELLGAATDDKAGILSMLRQGAGLTTLQSIFDKADYSQRLYGKIRMEAIRKNFSKGKVMSILGHEPDPAFFSLKAAKYSLAAEQGNYSTTQRQMELQQLLHFREMGIPITNKSILNAAFITNKKQVIADMEEEQQAQAQQAQAQAQQQQQKDQAELMEKYAKSKVDLAKEKELIASTMEKNARLEEIHSEAEYKQAKADMEMVKTMIELEDLDLANLRASLELAERIKTREPIGII